MVVAAVAAVVAVVAGGLAAAGPASGGAPCTGGCDLAAATVDLAGAAGGPPGVVVLVDRGGQVAVHTVGTRVVGIAEPIGVADHLRLASVSKAFSGAVALALVARGTLRLSDTVGRWLPGLPAAWSPVTLAELLQHTSGIPDFSQGARFVPAVLAARDHPPPPRALLSYVDDPALLFAPGTAYAYSNSDNVLVALMVQAATHRTYTRDLGSLVLGPLRLRGTSLPVGSALPAPYVHGYTTSADAAPEDVSHLVGAGWSWSSGGMVSTPRDTDRFVRAYVAGVLTDAATHARQFRFRPGSSEPPGPGTNSAGLGIFRYATRCGTVYGHTGNTSGYTNFTAATADGAHSVVVSVNAQLTPKTSPAVFPRLLRVELDAVCSALGR